MTTEHRRSSERRPMLHGLKCESATNSSAASFSIAGALRRLRRDCEGSSLIEFGLCSLVLMVMTFGLIEACFAIYSYNFVSEAAREAARYASVRGSHCSGMSDCGITQSGLQNWVRGTAFPGINANNLTATVTWYRASTTSPVTWTICACNAPGDKIQVKLTYTFPLSIPYLPSRILSMQSTSQMMIYN